MEHEWSMSARHRAQLRFWKERPLTCDSSLPQTLHYIYRIQNILGNQTKVKFEFEEIDFRSNNWFFVQFPQNQLFALIAIVFSRTEALQYAKVHTWKRFRDSYEMLKDFAMLSDGLSSEILIGCYPRVLSVPAPCLMSSQCPQSQYKYKDSPELLSTWGGAVILMRIKIHTICFLARTHLSQRGRDTIYLCLKRLWVQIIILNLYHNNQQHFPKI